ncbi:MAG: lysylphosphatidylglycerol synthase transmembrane domain-containing protein [Planctomycetia bacterium]|nr:lysylphosphatidylglycerol synthase transmembrane domain-containing protein [Planctomycetia bacterium]
MVPQKHRWRRASVLVLKLMVALVGLWYVTRQITWHNQVFLKPGSVIRGVVVLREVPIRLLHLGNNIAQVAVGQQRLRVRLASRLVVDGVPDRAPMSWPAVITIPRQCLVSLGGMVEIRRGLPELLLSAHWWPLLIALGLLGLPTFITAWRWWKLLTVQTPEVSYGQCLRLTFVGQFYSVFLPGSVSGDVVKMVYAGKATGNATGSAVSIVLDRVVGLVALLVLALLTTTALLILDAGVWKGPAAWAHLFLIHVWWIIAGLLLATGMAVLFYLHRPLRRFLRIESLLGWLPLPMFIKHAHGTLQRYRSHSGLMGVLFVVSLLSQGITPLAGWFIGRALAMQAPLDWYLVCLPVVALAVSVPILPPMGLGVLDSLLLFFFVTHGIDTANQAFALAQALRFLPLCWSMLGAYWVLRGKFMNPAARHQPGVGGG